MSTEVDVYRLTSSLVDEYIEGLFSKDAFEQPSDSKKPEDLEMKLPEWFDEKQFNKARRFYWNNCYMLSSSMLNGLVAVFAIPSILQVLIGTKRSNSPYTAYKRYLSTLLHTLSWFEHELKPGSRSWRSLFTVRTRHFKASLAAKLKNQPLVSQRDLALTQFGFIGFSMIKSDKFGIRQFETGDWEAYNHFWRTIGHLIGLEDKYNLCRKNVDETRQACQILLDRVYTPCLENVPEYFEHVSRAMLEGLWCVNPTVHIDGMLYFTKYLCSVPGYVYTEQDRIELQQKCMKQLNGRSDEIGIETSSLMAKPLIDLPPRKHLIYIRDYDSLETVPPYKRLPLAGKYKTALYYILSAFYTSYIGRIYLNLNFRFSLFLMKYFPYMAFFRFGIIKSYVNIFKEDPMDNAELKPNSEYEKPQPPLPLYKELLSLIW
ncbi:hypothetical protein KGM_207067 [Danaus plexippus plexippus]|uniref:Uncharacterized protein n=1 Tax=Danaus plexippus plexippus TaxID=278856 RepID=A0A212FMP3_DANPL|nr:hypothetical protein KGM_207067 [Danaus plexippus plexippus]